MSTLGLIRLKRGQYDLAKEAFNSALKLNPQNGFSLINLGDIYFTKQSIKQALYYWQQAADHTPLFHIVQRRLRYLEKTPIDAHYWIHNFRRISIIFRDCLRIDMKPILNHCIIWGGYFLEFCYFPTLPYACGSIKKPHLKPPTCTMMNNIRDWLRVATALFMSKAKCMRPILFWIPTKIKS